MIRFSLFFATLIFAHAIHTAFAEEEGQEPDFVWVNQKEGSCRLQDFGERPDGNLHGLRLRFSSELDLQCAFYVTSDTWRDPRRNAISAGGMFSGTHASRHYGYEVAFFDDEENLIACAGGYNGPDPVPAKGVFGSFTPITRLMDIPHGVHKRVASYRVAYCESNLPIGKVAWNEREVVTVLSTKGDTGETTEQSWPRWKSDGELREKPFQVQEGSRLLPGPVDETWRAETTEGKCSLKKKAPSLDQDGPKAMDTERSFFVTAGTKLALKSDCHFIIDEDNAIETWMNFQNPSDNDLFGQLYIAFFDSYGNLVGCIQSDSAVKAHGTMPEVRVNGELQFSPTSLQTIQSAPLPRGLEDKITSYKITLYESKRTIGEVRDSTIESP
jgi:hypothetical protein